MATPFSSARPAALRVSNRLQQYCEERVILGDISVVLTERCPLRCLHCNFWREPTPRLRELSPEEIREVLLDAYSLGFRKVNFTGGEPFLRSDLRDIVAIASRIGFANITLNTSGFTLREDDFKWLPESEVTTLTFSIDGIGEIHDKFRGMKGAFQKLELAMERLQGKMHINANMVIHSGSVDQIREVAQFLLRYGATFTVQPFEMHLMNSSRMEDLPLKDTAVIRDAIKELRVIRADRRFRDILRTSSAHINVIEEYLNDSVAVKLPCFVGYTRPHVGADGDVFPCYPLGVVGNIKEKSFREIWHSERYRRLRPAMLRRQCPNCLLNCYTRINIMNLQRYNREPLLRVLDQIPLMKRAARWTFQKIKR